MKKHNDDDEKKDKKNSNSGLMVACWLLALLLLIIVFFIKKNDIASNLEKTHFIERVGGKTPDFIKKEADEKAEGDKTYEIDLLGKDEESQKNGTYEEATGSESVKAYEEELEAEKNKAAEENNSVMENENQNERAAVEKTEKADKPADEEKTEKSGAVQKAPVKAVPQTRTASLFFVTVNSDGSITRKNIKRELSKSDSPLTDAINCLLAGPTPQEKASNSRSLIPDGTRLLGASVKNGVATLNFSEEFEFGQSFGVDGYIASLMQIVYTATEFSTVTSVQILIDGEKKDYLGSEGQWIGSPLARSSFN